MWAHLRPKEGGNHTGGRGRPGGGSLHGNRGAQALSGEAPPLTCSHPPTTCARPPPPRSSPMAFVPPCPPASLPGPPRLTDFLLYISGAPSASLFSVILCAPLSVCLSLLFASVPWLFLCLSVARCLSFFSVSVSLPFLSSFSPLWCSVLLSPSLFLSLCVSLCLPPSLSLPLHPSLFLSPPSPLTCAHRNCL